MTPAPMMNNFGVPGQQGPPPMSEEPVEKKRKTVNRFLLFKFHALIMELTCVLLPENKNYMLLAQNKKWNLTMLIHLF